MRQQVDIGNLQFGFMAGKGTTDAIFIVRQSQEKYREKKKDLFLAFIDLEKHLTGSQGKLWLGHLGKQVWKNGWSQL